MTFVLTSTQTSVYPNEITRGVQMGKPMRSRAFSGFAAIGDYIGVAPETARRLIAAGRLPVVRLSPRIVLGRPEVLDEYLSNKEKASIRDE